MDPLVTYSAVVSFVKQLSITHKNVKHTNAKPKFHEFIEDFKGTELYYPAIIMLPLAGGIIDNKSDNRLRQFDAGMWILQSIAPEDFSKRNAAMDDLFEIGWDFMTAFEKEAVMTRSDPQNRIIKGFDPQSVRWESTGPHEDQCWGWEFTWSFRNPKSLAYNSARWTNNASS